MARDFSHELERVLKAFFLLAAKGREDCHFDCTGVVRGRAREVSNICVLESRQAQPWNEGGLCNWDRLK